MSAISIYRTTCLSWWKPRCKTLLTQSVLQLVRYYLITSCQRLTPHIEDEMDVSTLNLGMIAAYYNISCASSNCTLGLSI